jgi:hypothetical protein
MTARNRFLRGAGSANIVRTAAGFDSLSPSRHKLFPRYDNLTARFGRSTFASAHGRTSGPVG